jgi:hypothetical protein
VSTVSREEIADYDDDAKPVRERAKVSHYIVEDEKLRAPTNTTATAIGIWKQISVRMST